MQIEREREGEKYNEYKCTLFITKVIIITKYYPNPARGLLLVLPFICLCFSLSAIVEGNSTLLEIQPKLGAPLFQSLFTATIGYRRNVIVMLTYSNLGRLIEANTFL